MSEVMVEVLCGYCKGRGEMYSGKTCTWCDGAKTFERPFEQSMIDLLETISGQLSDLSRD